MTGADSLAAGTYDFICSVHPYMTGTLTVGGGGSGGGGGHAGHDMKAPKLSVKVLDTQISEVLDAGALSLQVKLDEPATVRPVAARRRDQGRQGPGEARVRREPHGGEADREGQAPAARRRARSSSS